MCHTSFVVSVNLAGDHVGNPKPTAFLNTLEQGNEADGPQNLVAIPLDTKMTVVPVTEEEMDHDYDQLWPDEDEVGWGKEILGVFFLNFNPGDC